MYIDAISRETVCAGRYRQPSARQPLALGQMGPGTWQQARPVVATSRRPLPVGSLFWRNCPAVRGTNDLGDPLISHDSNEVLCEQATA